MLIKPTSTYKNSIKYVAAGFIGLSLLVLSAKGFAQSAPPTPPPPDKVISDAGKALKKINPFKSNGKARKGPKFASPPAGGPPPPPNPLNLFKKKKGGPTLPPPPIPGRD